MTHKPTEEFPPELSQPGIPQDKESGKHKVPVDSEPTVSPEAAKLNNLTPEEQMALYEKELKEDDWGHQPC